MNTLKFLLPFSYFFRSRLQSLTDIIFHFYYEWLLAFLLLFYFSGFDVYSSIGNFLLAYLAFIAIYEIGYLGNDIYSVRYETHPRMRIKDLNPNNIQLTVWIVFRVIVFLSITHYLALWASYAWWAFYSAIILFFYLHNKLRQKELKTFTFINLAFVRFMAPIFIFLNSDHLLLIIPSVFLCYVFYRTLTYMDSKKLLKMPSRPLPSFKVNYYLLIGGVSILLSFILNSYLPIFINAYYLFFWLTFYFKKKIIK